MRKFWHIDGCAGDIWILLVNLWGRIVWVEWSKGMCGCDSNSCMRKIVKGNIRGRLWMDIVKNIGCLFDFTKLTVRNDQQVFFFGEDACWSCSSTLFLDIYTITTKKEATVVLSGLLGEKLGTWGLEEICLTERWIIGLPALENWMRYNYKWERIILNVCWKLTGPLSPS